MLDKNKYQNRDSIIEEVRKRAKEYFGNSNKGKNIPDTNIKKVLKRKVVNNNE